MSAATLLRITIILLVLFACKVEANNNQSDSNVALSSEALQQDEYDIEEAHVPTFKGDSIKKETQKTVDYVNAEAPQPEETQTDYSEEIKEEITYEDISKEDVTPLSSENEVEKLPVDANDHNVSSDDSSQSAKKDDTIAGILSPIPVIEQPFDDSTFEDFKDDALHDIWNELLQEYVSKRGVVNYAALKNKELQLDEYLAILSTNVPSKESVARETMAFWINAYNAFTIKLILKNYPLNSIRDLDNGNPWDVKWIELGGNKFSLNQIEHEILRPTFNDPRIHFAVNCAAKSCPKLSNKAFTKENVEVQLENLTTEFVQNKQLNSISPKKLEISKIFEWYSEDFGDIRQFISQYSGQSISPKATVKYTTYDWSLNEK